MDKETVKYILTYYYSLQTIEETKVIEYFHLLKLDDMIKQNPTNKSKLMQMYKDAGWLPGDESLLDDLFNGDYDSFEQKVAERILSEFPNEVFLNYCPNCGKLARTPYAKQCRHCSYDWHNNL